MSLWGGVVVGVGLGYPMLLYYVCHEESCLHCATMESAVGVAGWARAFPKYNRRFAASLVVRSAERVVPFLRG